VAKSKKRSYRSEYESYQPNSPLTQHYITTGAVLPEKEEPTITKRKRNIKVLLRSKKSR